MAGAAATNKAKIAKRVIEVLEFFDEEHREATVMDIVRRYKRPQSSTSDVRGLEVLESGIILDKVGHRGTDCLKNGVFWGFQ
ncbi:MAG TPA: hypothetical protein VF463_10750 [Sphingobium sp.]